MKKIFIVFLMCMLVMVAMAISVNAEDSVDNSKYVPKVITTKDGDYKMVFDSELARTAHQLSLDAYDIGLGSGVSTLSNFKNEKFVDIQENFVWDDDIINAGFYSNNFIVGVKTFYINGEEKHILAIAFRGTDADNLIEWTRDALTDLTFFETYGFHAGFYSSAIKSYEKLLKMEFPSLKNDDGSNMTFDDYLGKMNLESDKYAMLVTGHSLGGAVANIFAGDILAMFAKRNVMCYTFASPIVATYDKAKNYDAYNIFNIVNTEDIIPSVGVNFFEVNGRRLGTDFQVDVTDSTENAHNCAVTYKKATNMVINDIDRLYHIAYRKKHIETVDKITVLKDELHILEDCSLEEGLFSGELGSVEFIIHTNVDVNTDISTYGDITTGDSDGFAKTVNLGDVDVFVGGDFAHSHLMNIGKGSITVNGTFYQHGECTMEDDDGYVLINGTYDGCGTVAKFNATAGVLEVKGNITDFKGYNASGTHKLILSGDKKQEIDMTAGDVYWDIGRMNDLEIINESQEGVWFTERAYATGEIFHRENSKVTGSENIILTEGASVRSVWNGDLSAAEWKVEKESIVNGDLTFVEVLGEGVDSSINANVTVSGDLIIPKDMILDISSCTLNADNLFAAAGSKINLADFATIYINNNFSTVSPSELNVSNGRVEIGGNFDMGGICTMDDASGYVLVIGDLINYGNKFNATAGVLEVKGNITDFKGYNASGIHKLILSGTKGQKIDMTNGDVYWDTGEINILEVTNTSEEGVDFTEYAYVIGELYADVSSKIINGVNIIITKDADVQGVWNGDLSASNWVSDKPCEINGNLQFNDHLGQETVISENIIINGEMRILDNVTLSVVAGVFDVDNCYVHRSGKFLFTSPAKMTVNGNFALTGTLNIGPAEVIIIGDLNKTGSCIMEENNGYFLIYGDLNNESSSFKATAGVLEVKGSISDFNKLRASGTHKIILSGDKAQKIDAGAGQPDWDVGEINELEITNTSEEGVEFTDYVKVLSDIFQPIGTEIKGREYVMLQDKSAFVDYGKLNEAINVFNGNAENVIPTWLDYERYYRFEVMGDKVFAINETMWGTSFDCDLYFSDDYIKKSAVVIIAFYDDEERFIQMASKQIESTLKKVDFSIDFENKPYSKYKIMVWEGLNNLKPLMVVK